MTLRAMEREIERLERNEEKIVELYTRAYRFFDRLTRKATGKGPESKDYWTFLNAALWEFMHHAWIQDRADAKPPPKGEKG